MGGDEDISDADRQAAIAELSERVAHIGSFEWDVAVDRLTWSDELYRIYGLEPETFELSFTAFLARVHPDDRAAVQAKLTRALDQQSSFRTEERIVRPDGEVRMLSTWGEVVADENGCPVRVLGICQDVTERRRAEEALRRSNERLNSLIRAAPDAVLVVDAAGTIARVNEQASTLFGYDARELVGQAVEVLLPERFRGVHSQHRATYVANPRRRPMGAGLQLFGRRKDGSEFPVDVSLSTVEGGGATRVIAFVRDITERKHAEQIAQRLRDAELRRRQAMEINDNVVQGLAAAAYALEQGHREGAVRALEGTLQAAQAMMAELLTQSEEPMAPGDLVRARPAASLSLRDMGLPQTRPAPLPARPLRVVIADDSEDVRLLLRLALDRRRGFEVVAEAVDGAEAVAAVAEHRPDLVVLDLAMPVMDGLEAIGHIRERSPECRIVVLSGFAGRLMREEALSLGADAYLEKGTPMRELVAVADRLCPGHVVAKAPTAGAGAGAGGLADDPAVLSHELKTPVTVIKGLVDTLHERIDVLPSATVHELLATMARNADQLVGLLDAFADARKLEQGEFDLLVEETDIAALVREVVADLATLTEGRSVVVSAPASVMADVDPLRLRQVVMNLVSNASKFSPAGSPIEIDCRVANDVMEVAVIDHGSGVPPERQGELFGKFSRLGSTGKGMGLGLYLSRGIARAHGGDLVLARTGPDGSTFLLRVPLRRTADADLDH